MKTESATVQRYQHIDALRAFAVMLVVIAHAGLGWIVPGGSGVTIFFAISGFIIASLLMREFQRTESFSAKSFYSRRALKILPPLFLVVVIPSLLIRLVDAQPIRLDGLGAQVLFVYNWFEIHNGPDGVLSGSQVVWSLAIEEQFYLLFAPFWLIAIRTARPLDFLFWSASGIFIMSNVLRFVLAAGENSERIYRGTDTRIDAVAIGIVAATLMHSHQRSEHTTIPDLISEGYKKLLTWRWTFLIAIAIYLLTLMVRDPWFRDTLRYPLQAAAASLVILCGFSPRIPYGLPWARTVWQRNWIQIIGLSSYSIYLVHLTLIVTADRWTVTWPPIARITFNVLMSLGAGLLMYFYVEKPFERLRARLR